MQEAKSERDIVLVWGQCPIIGCVMDSKTKQSSDAARRVADDGATVGFDAAWTTPPPGTEGTNIPVCRSKGSEVQ